MNKLKQYWKKLFGNTSYPTREILCYEILERGELYRECYWEKFYFFEQHHLPYRPDQSRLFYQKQVSGLQELLEMSKNLLEMLSQVLNFLDCIPHNASDRKALSMLIEDVEFDRDQFVNLVESIKYDTSLFHSHLLWTMGLDPEYDVIPDSSYYLHTCYN